MVLPAAQLADRMPDGYIQLWAASLLKGLEGTTYSNRTLVKVYRNTS